MALDEYKLSSGVPVGLADWCLGVPGWPAI